MESELADRIQDAYNYKYPEEDKIEPFSLHPDAFTTNRYDDAARLMRGLGGRALEIASNTGRFSLAICDQFDSLDGIDIASTAVKTANKAVEQQFPQYRDKVDFTVGNAERDLKFPDNTFDVVIALAVLEHLVMIYDALDEWARVCKPGGSLILCVPNMAYIKHVGSLLLGKQPKTGTPTMDAKYCRDHGWDGHHFHYFTKSSLTDLLNNTGWVAESWSGDGKLAKLRRWNQNFMGTLTVRARRKS